MPSNPQPFMDSLYSPSFNTLFNSNLADSAARVTAADNDNVEDSSGFSSTDNFEFNLSDLTPIDGDSNPVYPVFDRDLLRGFNLVGEVESPPSESTTTRILLKNLFLEDRDFPSSSSSSDVDDLEQIPPGTYCVWAPNRSPSESPSPGRCTKSSSTGSSSKAWNLRDLLLKRSKSDGKDDARFRMFLTPKQRAEATESGAGNGKKAAARGEKNKRRTYLPYRQDLVAGFFVSPHALRKATTTRLPIFR